MMTVLYFSHDDDKFGAPKSLLKMVEILKKDYNVNPIVVTPRFNQVNVLCNEKKIKNISFNYCHSAFRMEDKKIKTIAKFIKKFLKYKISTFSTLFKIKRLFLKEQVDLIHSNVSVIDIGFLISKKFKKKHIWHLREFGDLDFNFQYYNDVIRDLNNSDKVIAISNVIKNAWEKKGVLSNNLNVIYNGIDFREINEKNSFRKNNYSDLKIIFCGSATKNKGHEQLIEAINILVNQQKISNIFVDFYGDYDNIYGSTLKKKIKQYSIEKNICFYDFSNTINDDMNKYDVGVICSKSEAFGRITIEYMMKKLAVIASNTGANLEIITNNENGLLYNYGDCFDLAKKIEFLYSSNDDLNNLAHKGFEHAVLNYTAQKNAEGVYKIYCDIINI